MKTSNYTYTMYAEGEANARYGRTESSKGSPTPNGKWGLFYGIHRGTLMSRDQDAARYEYDSYAECVAALEREAHHFAALQHFIWFATAIAPDGTRHQILEGASYR